jgi:hypothetical protein
MGHGSRLGARNECPERLCCVGAERTFVPFRSNGRRGLIGDLQSTIPVDTLARLFRPVGPTNFQFRRHNGVYLPLEISPRLSSSTSLREAFGTNDAEMCIEYFLEGRTPAPR